MTSSWSAPVVRWLPGALLLGGLVFDAVTPVQYTGDPFFATACVLAGATQGLRATVVTCLFAVAAIVLLTVGEGQIGDHRGIANVITVVVAVAVAVGVNRALERYGRRLATVRGVSEAAQRALMPAPPTRIGPLGIAARYDAAAHEARIGGDVYAAQETPFGIRLLIGDVRGKGMGAVGAVAVLLGAFREAADDEPDLLRLADRLDRALDRHKEQGGDETRFEGFTTGLLAEYTPDCATLRLVNRGHPPPYLITADGEVRTLEPTTPDLPFGMQGLGGVRSAPDETDVPRGATLLLVTDGVTESRDRHGTFYDPASRLPALGPLPTPHAVVDALRADLAVWTAHSPSDTDDRAMLAVRRD
ncbi:PP2C family protein-serine/threonine phosphatase [Streptomyces sp. NRRL F-5123]|uniref:PP2C family protein-serine/threonine phosphatase n=1 Tax=Streptomyces sp. NRRL F-5123 TaxID=1463856 RepID=UPI001F16FEDD|nr:PP2C family protein-serine/threonine phosphatase [Streptomyces sp. NRRL F-5123]